MCWFVLISVDELLSLLLFFVFILFWDWEGVSEFSENDTATKFMVPTLPYRLFFPIEVVLIGIE